MIDADDVLAPDGVERMLEAAVASGADSLVGGSILFAGDEFPYDPETGAVTAPIFAHYMPLGASLVAGVIDPAVFGGPVIMIRREVFEAVGGYRELRDVAHEDWELHARLALAGYDTDVIPEYLHFYRQLDDGLSRISDPHLAKQRVIEAYDRHLAPSSMYGAARALHALHHDWQTLERHTEDLERQLRSGAERFHAVGLAQNAFDDPDNQGPLPVRVLRQLYRRHVPFETRLRIHARIMKLLRMDATP